MQQRRVQVMRGNSVLDGVVTNLVASSEGRASFNSSAGDPHRKRAWVMIASNQGHFLSAAIFSDRSPTKLAAPHALAGRRRFTT